MDAGEGGVGVGGIGGRFWFGGGEVEFCFGVLKFSVWRYFFIFILCSVYTFIYDLGRCHFMIMSFSFLSFFFLKLVTSTFHLWRGFFFLL